MSGETNTTPQSLDSLLATFDAARDGTARSLAAMALVRTRLTEARRARLERINERADRLWVPVPDPFPSGPPARKPASREPRPERNAPCPCGSGKKYKKCCALERNGGGRLH